MKRSLAVICLLVMALAPVLIVTDAWARAGGGTSSGSRGSRSYSSPAKPSPSPSQPASPVAPAPQPQRPGWGAGIMGGLAGFALGGLLGSMLFGGGMGGGIGFLEILLIAGGAFLLWRMFRSRQAQPAGSYGQSSGGPSWQNQTQASEATPTAPMAGATTGDLDRGLSYIRQMDGGFDPARFSDQASGIFCE